MLDLFQRAAVVFLKNKAGLIKRSNGQADVFEGKSSEELEMELFEVKKEIDSLEQNKDTVGLAVDLSYKKKVFKFYGRLLTGELELRRKAENQVLHKETENDNSNLTEEKKRGIIYSGIKAENFRSSVSKNRTESPDDVCELNVEQPEPEFEGFGLSDADIATARIVARQMIYNENFIEDVKFLHDEGYEKSAIEAAKMSKTFLDDLNNGRLSLDKKHITGLNGREKNNRVPVLQPAKKNEFYGPGVLSVGQKTAVMVLSNSMAVVYHTEDVKARFPEGASAEIKKMNVTENGVEAYTKDRQKEKEEEKDSSFKLFHGKLL